MGIIRLDYDYPAAPGDIDHPASFDFQVYYTKVPKMSFEACQRGDWNDDIKRGIDKALHYLINVKKVQGITGDCGFMMNYQKYIREHEMTDCPVFMSALA